MGDESTQTYMVCTHSSTLRSVWIIGKENRIKFDNDHRQHDCNQICLEKKKSNAFTIPVDGIGIFFCTLAFGSSSHDPLLFNSLRVERNQSKPPTSKRRWGWIAIILHISIYLSTAHVLLLMRICMVRWDEDQMIGGWTSSTYFKGQFKWFNHWTKSKQVHPSIDYSKTSYA